MLSARAWHSSSRWNGSPSSLLPNGKAVSKYLPNAEVEEYKFRTKAFYLRFSTCMASLRLVMTTLSLKDTIHYFLHSILKTYPSVCNSMTRYASKRSVKKTTLPSLPHYNQDILRNPAR